MPNLKQFKYSVKGTADETANPGIIAAVDKDLALERLKEVYGDNPELVAIEFITDEQFDELVQANTADDVDGNEQVHKIDLE